jgi:hypothetical protein
VQLFIISSLANEVAKVDTSKIAAERPARLFGLAASSIIVMSSSVRVLVNNECGASSFCKRTKFGVASGALSFVASLALALMMQRNAVPLALEFYSMSTLLIWWCFTVGFVTFGTTLTAPGAAVGNLYFSCWISFILVVFMFAQAFRDFLASQVGDDDDDEDEEERVSPSEEKK